MEVKLLLVKNNQVKEFSEKEIVELIEELAFKLLNFRLENQVGLELSELKEKAKLN